MNAAPSVRLMCTRPCSSSRPADSSILTGTKRHCPSRSSASSCTSYFTHLVAAAWLDVTTDTRALPSSALSRLAISGSPGPSSHESSQTGLSQQLEGEPEHERLVGRGVRDEDSLHKASRAYAFDSLWSRFRLERTSFRVVVDQMETVAAGYPIDSQ